MNQAAARFDNDSQRLGVALSIIETMLRAVGTASSTKELKDAEPMKRARAFLQGEMSR
ncbi:hypothetical protein [Roseiterribacter gracilis]|uniref:Uncharacterized protein n=1 Tax=Roseiterribacter gracilis TaxID=2812848 RepID=A0A8S8XIV9_9PROT|nr:hypothetical protein TMPK1_29270 [Rhodospirillales bacterium TMPK1]